METGSEVSSLIWQSVSLYLVFFGTVLPFYILLGVVGLRGFMRVTRFETGSSLLYRLNPLTKLVLGIGVSVASSLTIWWFGLLLGLIVLLSYLSMEDGRRKFISGSLIGTSTLLGVVWGLAPFTPSSIWSQVVPGKPVVLWVWPQWAYIMGYTPDLTLQSLEYGVQVASRVFAVIISSLILVMTTTPSDLFRALNRVKVPIEITFILVAAMKFFPKVVELIDTSVKVQSLRRGKSRVPSLLFIAYAGIMSLTPVIFYMLRQARDMSISVDTRAFRAKRGRSSLKEFTFSREDRIVMGLTLSLVILSVVLSLTGLGRPIPFVGS